MELFVLFRILAHPFCSNLEKINDYKSLYNSVHVWQNELVTQKLAAKFN